MEAEVGGTINQDNSLSCPARCTFMSLHDISALDICNQVCLLPFCCPAARSMFLHSIGALDICNQVRLLPCLRVGP